jgi:hypothetical protein
MGEPELLGFRDAPPRQYGPGWRPLDAPSQGCSECDRLAEWAEERGEKRPNILPIRSWVARGRLYFAALCVEHSQQEHCWRFQQARKALIGKDEKLSEFDKEHVTWLAVHKQACRCREALERTPFSVMTYEELFAHKRALRLHVCSCQCGRMLVHGVTKCFECRSGRTPDFSMPMPPDDWDDEDRSLFPRGFEPCSPP